MKVSVKHCLSCQKPHEGIKAETVKDKNGRDRVQWTCPNTGKKASQWPSAVIVLDKTTKPAEARQEAPTAAPPAPRPRREAPVGRSDESSVVGGLQTLTARIPMQVEAEPSLSAAWDIARGFLDRLAERGIGSGPATIYAQGDEAAEAARATGRQAKADGVEYRFGQACADAAILNMAHRRMGLVEWAALFPRELDPSGASAVAGGGGAGGAGGQGVALTDLFGPGGGPAPAAPGGSRLDGAAAGAMLGGAAGAAKGGARGAVLGALLGALGGAGTDPDVAGNVGAGALTGAMAGSRFGPVGGAIGALAGGALGYATAPGESAADAATFGPAGELPLRPRVGPTQ